MDDTLNCRSLVVSIDDNNDVTAAVALIDTLINSQLEKHFVLKSLLRIVFRFHSNLNSKRQSLLSFVNSNSLESPLSPLLSASLSLVSPKQRKPQFQSILQSLHSAENINQKSLELSFLLALRVCQPFPLPFTSILKSCLSLISTPPLDPLKASQEGPVLRESGFRILEALVVTLENDILVFCPQINRTIVDSIERYCEPWSQAFLERYLSLKSIQFSKQDNRKLNSILSSRLHSPASLRCLALLAPNLESDSLLETLRQFSRLLLLFYGPNPNNELFNESLRKEFWKTTVVLSLHSRRHSTTVGLLSVAVIRDDSHVIRNFCSDALKSFEIRAQNETTFENIVETTVETTGEPVVESMEVTEPEDECSVAEPIEQSKEETKELQLNDLNDLNDCSEADLMLKDFYCE